MDIGYGGTVNAYINRQLYVIGVGVRFRYSIT